VRRLAGLEIPVILGFNKVDKGDKYIPEYIALWERLTGKSISDLKQLTILPLSGKSGINIEKLLGLLFEILPEGPPLYPEDTVCDIPQRMVIADIVREKLLGIMREEVPHALAVIIESIEPRRKKTQHINALILVEKDSHKAIVIGKGGQVLKKIGTQARAELEQLLESKVYLEVHVKVKKDWRDNVDLLQQMGYDSL
jgi:GTP-binding protein Era